MKKRRNISSRGPQSPKNYNSSIKLSNKGTNAGGGETTREEGGGEPHTRIAPAARQETRSSANSNKEKQKQQARGGRKQEERRGETTFKGKAKNRYSMDFREAPWVILL